MGSETLGSVLFWIPFLMVLGGFHGILFQKEAGRKVLSWSLFQAGWMGFLLYLEPEGGPWVKSTFIGILACSLGTTLLLTALGRKSQAKPGVSRAAGTRKGSS